MLGAKAVGIASTVVASGAAGAMAVPIPPRTHVMISMGIFGLVPLATILAVAVGIMTAVLVRIIIWTKHPQKLWTYNIAVTLLAVIFASTYIIDHGTSASNSAFVGAGFGAGAVAVVEVSRSNMLGWLREGLRSIAAALDSGKPRSDQDRSEG